MSNNSKQAQHQTPQYQEADLDDDILVGDQEESPRPQARRLRKKGRMAAQRQRSALEELAAEDDWDQSDWDDQEDDEGVSERARRALRRARSLKARSQEAATDDRPDWQRE